MIDVLGLSKRLGNVKFRHSPCKQSSDQKSIANVIVKNSPTFRGVVLFLALGPMSAACNVRGQLDDNDETYSRVLA